MEALDAIIARYRALGVPRFFIQVSPAAMPAALFEWLPRRGFVHYMAFDGDVPAAAAALYVDGDTGYFGPAATLPAYRGRGAQSAFIARRIRDAAALGCTLLVSETAEDRPDRDAPSFRNLRRFGFETAYLRPNYLLKLTTP